MKLNFSVLLATFLLIVVCAVAITHPRQSVMAKRPQPTVLADGGGGAPTPPCIPGRTCSALPPGLGINAY